MTDLSTLKQLQKRIREATGPDQDLDAAIYAWRHDCVSLGYKSIEDGWMFEYPAGQDCIDSEDLPHFTRDPDGLGACVALMRETLTVGHWSRTPDGTYRTYRAGWAFEARPLANDCLTFLNAICAAKIAELEAQEVANVSAA